MGLFDRFKEGLTKTRDAFMEKVGGLLTGPRKIDEDFFEELEEMLLLADVGASTTVRLLDELRKEVKARKLQEAGELRPVLKELLVSMIEKDDTTLYKSSEGLTVIMVVGVNGVGKTTTIGKLAYKQKSSGQKVLLAAGDTFRAGAIEQLEVWGQRVGVDVIRHKEGSDPAAVVFDAVQAAKARKVDVLIVDTAGRLHNKTNLMDELSKVYRVMKREIPDAPHEVLLVLDATTGQNALQQAKIFGEATGVTGLVLTKLDGTAKGGIAIAIHDQMKIPVKLVGLGEKMDDLQEFDARAYVEALL